MKTQSTLILPLIALAFAGCGKYDKQPVSDLEQLRAAGKEEYQRGPLKPQVLEKQVVVKEPVTVTKEVEVVKYEVVEKVVEQPALNEGVFVIKADADMNFVEGQSATFKIRARILRPEQISFQLVGKDLPKGASLKNVSTATDKDVYALTWSAPYSTVTGNDFEKNIPVKLAIEIGSVKNADGSANGALKQALEGIVREKTVNLRVLRDRTPPSEVKVEGLTAEVTEGTITPIQVIAKIPGVDQNSRELPVLHVYYDRVATTSGNNFLEMDGSRHITTNPNKKAAEFLGNGLWQFNLMFDTKNIAAQPQLAKDGKVMAQADGTRVRLTFKVMSPAGTSSPELLKLVKIRYDRPVVTPRFDFSGLKNGQLSASPGAKVSFKFRVNSPAAGVTLNVTSSDIEKLPGQKSLNCQKTSAQASQVECALEWQIPCESTVAELSRSIEFQASASGSGIAAENVTQVLTVNGIENKSLCQAGATAATKETK